MTTTATSTPCASAPTASANRSTSQMDPVLEAEPEVVAPPAAAAAAAAPAARNETQVEEHSTAATLEELQELAKTRCALFTTSMARKLGVAEKAA